MKALKMFTKYWVTVEPASGMSLIIIYHKLDDQPIQEASISRAGYISLLMEPVDGQVIKPRDRAKNAHEASIEG